MCITHRVATFSSPGRAAIIEVTLEKHTEDGLGDGLGDGLDDGEKRTLCKTLVFANPSSDGTSAG